MRDRLIHYIDSFAAYYLGAVLSMMIALFTFAYICGISYKWLALTLWLFPLLLGSIRFLKGEYRKFSPLLLILMMLLLLSITWTDQTEKYRGILIYVIIAANIPFASLLNSLKKQQAFIKTFLFFSVPILFLMSYYFFCKNTVFGNIVISENILMNRNEAALYLAFCSLLCMVRSSEIKQLKVKLLLNVLLFCYTAAIFATQSRGGIILIITMVVAFLIISSRIRNNRLDIVLTFAVIISSMCIMKTEITKRFHNKKRASLGWKKNTNLTSLGWKKNTNLTSLGWKKNTNLTSLGSRVYIWKAALQQLKKISTIIILGTGIGGVDKFIATNLDGTLVFSKVKNGIPRKNSHNIYLEYFLTLGILGLPFVVYFLFFCIKLFKEAWKQKDPFVPLGFIFFFVSGTNIDFWNITFIPAFLILLHCKSYNIRKILYAYMG